MGSPHQGRTWGSKWTQYPTRQHAASKPNLNSWGEFDDYFSIALVFLEDKMIFQFPNDLTNRLKFPPELWATSVCFLILNKNTDNLRNIAVRHGSLFPSFSSISLDSVFSSSDWLLFAVNGTDCAEEIDTIQPYNSVAAVEIKAPPNGRILTSGNRRVQQRWHVILKSVGCIDAKELSNDQ